jgi:hypothetical protein
MAYFVRPALALLAFAGCAHHGAPTSLGDVLIRNRAATWRTNEPSAIRSLEYEIHIKEPKFELDGVYKVNKLGQMRIDLYSGGSRVYTEGFDGHRGWAVDAQGKARDESPGGSAALWHGTQFPGKLFDLDELPLHGHRLEGGGRESIGGVDYYVVKIVLSDGFETYRYLNPTTFLIERGRDFRAIHPALDAKASWLEIVWTDYRPMAGVMRSFSETMTDLATGQWKQSMMVKSIRVNPEFDPELFQKPRSKSPDSIAGGQSAFCCTERR